jgi:hypothetical protein
MFRRDSFLQEIPMTKYLMMLMLLFGGVALTGGCEADADLDDDGAKLEVDIDN